MQLTDVDCSRQLLERLPAGAYTCDCDGLITYYNARAVELWGRAPALNDPKDRFCGSFRLYAIDGRPLSHGECWMALALRNGQAYDAQEIVIERPDGQRVTALAHANPLLDTDGELLGAVNVLLDISARKEAAERQRRLEAALAHMDRLNTAGEMASGLAHELNQPLTTISNYSEACQNRLRDGPVPGEELIATLSRIVEQADNAANIIRRLRGFTRRTASQRERTDVGGLICEAVSLITMDARRAGVAMEIDKAATWGPVKVDPVQIQQVLVNLMRNGIESMSETPDGERSLRITVTADSGALRFTVRDTGPGVAAGIRDQLFHPFKTTRADGMGLGLAISRTLVQAHGGELWADEPDGRGAAFHFTLPCLENAATQDHEPPASSSSAALTSS